MMLRRLPGDPVHSGLLLATAFFFVVVFSSIVLGLTLTNRIAGPLFRLQKHMEKVVDGETIEKMSFRKRDFFSDLVAPYNKILSRLRGSDDQKD